MNIIAFDCGLTGAWALLGSDGTIAGGDLPVIQDQSTKWIDGPALTEQLVSYMTRDVIFVVERYHANSASANGTVPVFSQGITLGSLLVTLQFFERPINFVAPGVWKKSLGIHTPKGVKRTQTQKQHASLDKARLQFPTVRESFLPLVKHHNRADALLLAHYWKTCKAPSQEWPA